MMAIVYFTASETELLNMNKKGKKYVMTSRGNSKPLAKNLWKVTSVTVIGAVMKKCT